MTNSTIRTLRVLVIADNSRLRSLLSAQTKQLLHKSARESNLLIHLVLVAVPRLEDAVIEMLRDHSPFVPDLIVIWNTQPYRLASEHGRPHNQQRSHEGALLFTLLVNLYWPTIPRILTILIAPEVVAVALDDQGLLAGNQSCFAMPICQGLNSTDDSRQESLSLGPYVVLKHLFPSN